MLIRTGNEASSTQSLQGRVREQGVEANRRLDWWSNAAYLGCFNDKKHDRVLSHKLTNENMVPQVIVNHVGKCAI